MPCGGLLLVALCVAMAHGYPSFQDAIPNGELVPHPCKPNYLWKGVGHFNVLGGGDRNPFGKDFAKFGMTWSVQLCELDSDGDGKTNGQELGDPDCKWNGGAPSNPAEGHPGVCEPIDSPDCKAKNAAAKGDWEFCEQGEFKCEGIDEPEVEQFKIAIDAGTKVPAKETTYKCQLVKLPDDQQYHIIASKPEIDNNIVAHHIIVHGCDELAAEKLEDYKTPRDCESMRVSDACKYRVGGWTVGQVGDCAPPNVGRKFGKRVFNYAVIEIHWNNPTLVPTYTDGSGITIFYTPELRTYDSGSLTVGQTSLAIPPGADIHYQTGYCTSKCTRDLDKPVYLYRSQLHMHYLGRGGRLEHWRNGSMVQVLIDDDSYSYDSPVNFVHDPPAVFMPGDELKMVCKFKSTTRSEITYFGEGTSDEMCLTFVNYYPQKDYLATCTNSGPLNLCRTKDKDIQEIFFEAASNVGCDMASVQGVFTKVATRAALVCNLLNPKCTPECKEYLQEVFSTEPCLRNDLRFMYGGLLEMFRGENAQFGRVMELLAVCDKDIIKANTVVSYMDERDYMKVATAGSPGLGASVLILAAATTVIYGMM